MKKIEIDKKKCIGCFKCKQVCYSVFEVGSDGKSKVRYGRENDVEEAQAAIINCPTDAIKIVETSNNNDDDDDNDSSPSLFNIFFGN